MKGVSLPINAVIIIVISILVLVTVISLFYTGAVPPREAISASSAMNNACFKLVNNHNCGIETRNIIIDNFDADKDTAKDPGNGWEDTVNDWTIDPLDVECGGDTGGNNEQDNLASLCHCHYQIWSETECKSLCHC